MRHSKLDVWSRYTLGAIDNVLLLPTHPPFFCPVPTPPPTQTGVLTLSLLGVGVFFFLVGFVRG